MSISFACPECRVQIEVGDEFAGLDGQCPRCQQVITIPSPNMPKPRPVVTAPPLPAKDRWEDSRDDRPRSPRARTRRMPLPRQPAGPTWPWVVGIAGAVVVMVLLFISFIVLVSYRRPEPPRPVVIDMQQGVNHQVNGVTVGRLDGQRAIMQDGVFQVRTQLNANDPFDREQWQSRSKRFQLDLVPGVDYVIEIESNHFDPGVRVENLNNRTIVQNFGIRGGRIAAVAFRPGFNQNNVIVCVTNVHQGVGDFTLTIREANRPAPNRP